MTVVEPDARGSAKSRTRAHLDFGDRSWRSIEPHFVQAENRFLSAPRNSTPHRDRPSPTSGSQAHMATISGWSRSRDRAGQPADLPTLTSSSRSDRRLDRRCTGAMSVAPLRLLVVDGRGRLEGWSTLLSDLAAASLRAGCCSSLSQAGRRSSVSAVMTTQHRRVTLVVLPST